MFGASSRFSSSVDDEDEMGSDWFFRVSYLIEATHILKVCQKQMFPITESEQRTRSKHMTNMKNIQREAGMKAHHDDERQYCGDDGQTPEVIKLRGSVWITVSATIDSCDTESFTLSSGCVLVVATGTGQPFNPVEFAVLEGAALHTIQISTERLLCNPISEALERYNAATARPKRSLLERPRYFSLRGCWSCVVTTQSTATARTERCTTAHQSVFRSR